MIVWLPLVLFVISDKSIAANSPLNFLNSSDYSIDPPPSPANIQQVRTMKTLFILSFFAAMGTLVAQDQPAQAQRSTAQVTLRATDKTVRPEKEKKKDDDKKDPKKDNKGKAETVTKTIEVEISAAKTINGPLKIVTHWYARDLGDQAAGDGQQA